MELLLASGNAKKLAELRRIVDGLGIRVLTPADAGPLPEVDEDGDTFEANAAKKARAWAAASGRVCIADDSGLEVDALDGAPGVHSARYAGRHGDDAANNQKLLAALAGRPPAERGARFVCAIHVAGPDGADLAAARGAVEGRIETSLRGEGGFGYDPLFVCEENGERPFGARTFGEVSHEQKATVSHRSRALRAIERELAALAAADEGPGRSGPGRS